METYHWSYWEYESFLKAIDFLIIGGGLVGLHAAIYLKEEAPAAKVVVIERGPLPIGASTRNAGFACFGSITELLDDLQHTSEEAVWHLVEKRYRGLQRLRQRFGDKILDYQELGGYELFRSNDSTIYERSLDALTPMNRSLYSITGNKEVFVRSDASLQVFGFQKVSHLIKNQIEGQLDTGKLMAALIRSAQEKGVICLNGITVEGLQQSGNYPEVKLGNGWTLQPKRLLVATNGFATQLLPNLEVKPARNLVLITEPISNLPLKGCFHYDRGYYYFRNINGRLLLGGGRNLALEAETTAAFGKNPTIETALKQLIQEVILPNREVTIDYWWSGILGVGSLKRPIVQAVNSKTVVAVRMGGMGVAIGGLIGEEAAQLLMEC